LVVEYGDIEYGPGYFDPPTTWNEIAPNLATTWTFQSLPNPEVENKTALVLIGQVVGGSSVVNGMQFDRGGRFDYDAWVEAGGPEFESSDIKWDWNGIYPFFKKVSLGYGVNANLRSEGNATARTLSLSPFHPMPC
jgi:choline dehydrogenase-like flavoprotein